MILTAIALAAALSGQDPYSATDPDADEAAAAAAEVAAAAADAAGAAADAARVRRGGMPDDPIVCTPDAATTPEINACAARDLAREEARMNQYLAAAHWRAVDMDSGSDDWVGLGTQQTAYLDASQEAWKAYAEITCRGAWDAFSGGTIRTVIYLGCKSDLTRERTHRIWQDHLTYMDSTPPELPEPTEPAGAEYDPAD